MGGRMESDQFTGFEMDGRIIVARFEYATPKFNYQTERYDDGFVLDHISCKQRLENLRNKNEPYDQTEKALQEWPAEPDRIIRLI